MAKLTPSLSQALSRAISAYNAGELVEAEQLCQQIINVKRDLFDALHLLALVQTRLGKKDTALTSFDRALAVRPDYAEALSNRGITLHELRRFEEALASFDRALAVRPDYAEALYNRGNTLRELRRFEQALASFDRALAVRPDYAEAHLNEALLRLLFLDPPYHSVRRVFPSTAGRLAFQAVPSQIVSGLSLLPAYAVQTFGLHPPFVHLVVSQRLSRTVSGRRLDCAPPWRVITPPPRRRPSWGRLVHFCELYARERRLIFLDFGILNNDGCVTIYLSHVRKAYAIFLNVARKDSGIARREGGTNVRRIRRAV